MIKIALSEYTLFTLSWSSILKVRFQVIISFRKIDENSHNAMPFILCAFLLTRNKSTLRLF